MKKQSRRRIRKLGPPSRVVRPARAAPTVFVSLSPARPTVVFDSYWRFAAERQRIFFARLEGRSQPWSRDPVLSQYKFTNAYRASDRTSQYLIRDVVYSRGHDARDTFFRIMLFKLFNKIETWRALNARFGEIVWGGYRYADYDRFLTESMRLGQTIYSAAYIMAAGNKQFSVERKHQAHLRLIEMMVRDSVPERLADVRSMKEGFELLRSYPLIGDFLAYQLITDLNYSTLTRFTEMEFTMPGPGAKDGIRKCFESLGGLSEVDVIRLMADRQEYEFERLGIEFRSLWGRRLQLIDVQNLFCEVDKYARVVHPHVKGVSGRTRIKQRFKGTDSHIEYFYPPKWGLNVPRLSAPSALQPDLL